MLSGRIETLHPFNLPKLIEMLTFGQLYEAEKKDSVLCVAS